MKMLSTGIKYIAIGIPLYYHLLFFENCPEGCIDGSILYGIDLLFHGLSVFVLYRISGYVFALALCYGILSIIRQGGKVGLLAVLQCQLHIAGAVIQRFEGMGCAAYGVLIFRACLQVLEGHVYRVGCRAVQGIVASVHLLLYGEFLGSRGRRVNGILCRYLRRGIGGNGAAAAFAKMLNLLSCISMLLLLSVRFFNV